MANAYFGDYDEKYPNIVIDILDYFSPSSVPMDSKNIMKFCELHKEGNELVYQPQIVSRICKRLCERGRMEILQSRGVMGVYDNYLSAVKTNILFEPITKECLQFYFNSMVYGFEYIYENYRENVLPLVCEIENGDSTLGTGFKYANGIVTAKHCITDVKNLRIKGYMAEELEGKPVYISDNDGVDLAFIETGRIATPRILMEKGIIIQEVLVMGYPKIPSFTNFITAEKATISSKASVRITPTRGSIVAYGYEYLAKIEAMLITAKIRGGNSGSPIINENGCLVGVACQLPNYEQVNGYYDDLGYGIAVPAKFVNDIVQRKPARLGIPSGFYRDFVEGD